MNQEKKPLVPTLLKNNHYIYLLVVPNSGSFSAMEMFDFQTYLMTLVKVAI